MRPSAAEPTLSRDLLVLVGLAVATVCVAGLALLVLNRAAPVELAWGARWTPGVLAIASGLVGIVVTVRTRGGPTGWLLLAGGALSGALFLASEVSVHVAARGGQPAPPLTWYASWSWIPAAACGVAAIVLAPGGRATGLLRTAVLALLLFATAGHTLLAMFGPELTSIAGGVEANPYTASWLPATAANVDAARALHLAVLGGALLSMLADHRGLDEEERHRRRWLVRLGASLLGSVVLVEVGRRAGTASEHYLLATVLIGGLATFVPLALALAVLAPTGWSLRMALQRLPALRRGR